jgi:hypothetical protein
MSSSATGTHARGTASSLALPSGGQLERRLEELLHQDRFPPPADFVAAASVTELAPKISAARAQED